MFAFKFVNFYSTLFYIAYFKDLFVGQPGNYTYLIKDCIDGEDPGYRWKGCADGGCSAELAIQLIFVMVGSEFFNLIYKGVVNFIGRIIFNKRKDKLIFDDDNIKTQWEKDFKLLPSSNWING